MQRRSQLKQVLFRGGCYNNETEIGIYSLRHNEQVSVEVRSTQDPYLAFASVRSESAF